MAKQRKGGEKSADIHRESGSEGKATGKPAMNAELDALGNAVLQARMETGEVEVVSGQPGLDVVAAVAQPLVQRAIAALQLDAADAERLAHRVGILERSHLPERDALIDQLHGDEAVRMTVDGLLERHFGGADAETRWAVDGALDGVRQALAQGQAGVDAWEGPEGRVEGLASEGSLDVRASGLIAALAEAQAPAAARGAATDGVGRSTASLVKSLALMVLLEEEEEEEGFVEDGWDTEQA